MKVKKLILPDMDKPERIDELFRQKLSEAESEPRPEAWDKLRLLLEEAEGLPLPAGRQSKGFDGRLSLMLSTAFLFIALALYWFLQPISNPLPAPSKEQAGKEKSSDRQVTLPSTEEKKEESPKPETSAPRPSTPQAKTDKETKQIDREEAPKEELLREQVQEEPEKEKEIVKVKRPQKVKVTVKNGKIQTPTAEETDKKDKKPKVSFGKVVKELNNLKKGEEADLESIGLKKEKNKNKDEQ